MHRRPLLRSAAALAFAPVLRAAPAVALLGAGQIGTRHAHAAGKMAAMRKAAADFHARGVAEPDEGARARAAKQAEYRDLPWLGVDELLADPEVRVVAVETTLEASTPMALRALRAGKHLHLDKPGGADHTAFASMRREAQQRGLIVQMGYMLRYNPAFALLFRAAREGWLGEITEIHASMGKLASGGLRRELAAIPGHGMFELGCHLVDAVLTLLGEPTRVIPFASTSQGPGDRLPDHQLAVLEYPRALVTLRCNHADPSGAPRRLFSVSGRLGSFEIQPLESGRFTLRLEKAAGGFPQGETVRALPLPGGRYDSEFADLAACARGQREFAWSADHDIAVHRTALRAAGVP